jgi:hypothetical protein
VPVCEGQGVGVDLVSAGLPEEGLEKARNSSQDLMERWDLVEPHWHAAKSTGYGRALEIAARDLYGIPAITRETLPELNTAFVAARECGGHFDFVLKEKSRIAVSILDADLGCDRRYFVSVSHPEGFLTPRHRAQCQAIALEQSPCEKVCRQTRAHTEQKCRKSHGGHRVSEDRAARADDERDDWALAVVAQIEASRPIPILRLVAGQVDRAVVDEIKDVSEVAEGK